MLRTGSWGSALGKWRFLFDARFGGVLWDAGPLAEPSCRPRGPRARPFSRGSCAGVLLDFGED